MIFNNDTEVINYVVANRTVPKWVEHARKYNERCSALIDPTEDKEFQSYLITRIEFIEGQEKAKARQKYAREISDLFTRISKPIANVFSATGAIKNYKNQGANAAQLSEADLTTLLNIVSNSRDNKSIEQWIQETVVDLLKTDPSGVIRVTYSVNGDKLDKAYPIYESIGQIRNYTPKGQMVECIVYEPVQDTDPDKSSVQYWKVIDDKKQYTVIQQGDTFSISTDATLTFEHPFGKVPVMIISPLLDKKGRRLSLYHKILGMSEEYGRDLSIKIIYKFLQGFPKSWIKDMLCQTCKGVDVKNCKDCGGTGWRNGKMDVTDVARIPIQTDTDMPPIEGKDIAGYVSPDIDTLEYFDKELDRNESRMFETIWGVQDKTEVQKTATEIYIDMQPMIVELNNIANWAEWVEKTIVELIANLIDTAKDKDKPVSSIVYGRRYILEGIDTIQKKYIDAKSQGANTVILDALFQELLTVKFKNDPANLRRETIKSRIEPYLHQSLEEIDNFFGSNETARKIYFQQWWSDLSGEDLQGPDNTICGTLEKKFNAAFETYLSTIKISKPLPPAPAPIPPAGTPPAN